MDCPALEFEYGDADGHAAELSGMRRTSLQGVEDGLEGDGRGLSSPLAVCLFSVGS